MPDADFADRTEPATPHKRREARERGHVAKSQDLVTALVLLAAFLAIAAWGERAVAALARGAAGILANIDRIELEPASFSGLAARIGLEAAAAVAPVLVAVFAAAFLGNVLQVGFVASGQAVAPDLARIDPIRGLRRIFSRRGLFRTLVGLLKIAAVAAVLGFVLAGRFEAGASRSPFGLFAMGPLGAAAAARAEVVRLGLVAALVLLAIALLDLAFQRSQYERDLRMTKQEVREELKRLEGDPKIRERRRRVMRQIARARMLLDTRRADVVITNPTEVAVALAYEERRDAAPRVLAKGEGLLAGRIREIAREEGIPIVERPPLARVLFRTVEVGAEIPPALYRAVAEVLAYVWKMGGRRGRPARA